MNALYRRLRGERGLDRHKYAPIGHSRDESDIFRSPRSRNNWTRKHILILIMVGSLAAITAVLGIG
jgi:DNA helicase HerA-like ATPase